MATSGRPASSLRHRPVNVTIAPMSLRPPASSATSRPPSNPSWCRGMVRPRACSIPGHWREERYFACSPDGGLGLDMHAIERRANDLRVLESMRIFLPALAQPVHEVRDGGYYGGKLDLLLGLANALPHPCKVSQLHRLNPPSGGAPRHGNSPSRYRA